MRLTGRKKVWNLPARDVDVERRITEAMNLTSITASVLVSRGVVTVDRAATILSCGVGASSDPFLLPDMEQAVDRIRQAVLQRESVLIHGDYDVDGVTATSIYLHFLQRYGLQARFHIPHRLRDGYGLTTDAITRSKDQGVSLLITADCGTTSREEVALAKSFGIDVIITDHHELGDEPLPEAVAVINPCRADSTYPFRGLCSGALAFKVAQAYGRKYGHGVEDGPAGPHGEDCVDLVALATVADMAPLVGENRMLVREGLKRLSMNERTGIKALKTVANVSGACSAETVGYALAPRINAAGRLDDATVGVRLLVTSSEQEAWAAALRLERLNQERRRTQEATIREAERMLRDAYDGYGPIVVSDAGWHPGVVGIVASQLADQYYRPAVVIAIDGNNLGRGSARSIPEFDLFHGMNRCRSLMESFGGHQYAAGLTIREDRIPAFRQAFSSVVQQCFDGLDPVPRIDIDAEVDFDALTFRVVEEFESLGPFGTENPEPLLAARGVRVNSSRRIANRHLGLKVRSQRGYTFDAIGFGMGDFLDDGTIDHGSVDLAFRVVRDRWQGDDRLRLNLVDLRAAEPA